jgi:outer membrane protein TolC
MTNEPTYSENANPTDHRVTSANGCPMNARNDATGTAKGRRRIASGYAPWITAAQACLIIALLVTAGAVLGRCRPALGADPGPAAQTQSPDSPLNYEDAVKIAIAQSPYFAKSSVDIEIRRLDETDSRYSMVPPLTFRTYYYVNRPTGVGSGKPYSLNFSMDPYNPLGAYYTLQAQKLVTRIAVFAHLKVISTGLFRLGAYYLQLDAMHKMAACQTNIIQLCRENLTYVENRMSIGTATSLDVSLARQQLELAQGEQEAITLTIKRDLVGLKNFLGLQHSQTFTPNYQDSRRQVLGTFDPATASLEQAKKSSYDLRSMKLYQELQNYNIRQAIVKVFPSFLFNTQTPDPLSVTTGSGLYVGLGLEIPVWDGFKRVRNISRQRAVLKQMESQTTEKSSYLEDKWYENLASIKEKGAAMRNSQAQEKLARLKDHQQELRYDSGNAPLTAVLESRREVLQAHKEALRRGLDYDKEVLLLREKSGDLGNTYVDANSWQK